MRSKERHTSLLARISLPVFALIVTVIAIFALSASYILIRLQNDHNRQMAEQSMKFVYRNLEYQLDTMNNMAAFLLTNPSVENLLETQHPAPYEAIDDYFALETNLQNLSLLSLLNDSDSRTDVQQSYVIAVALEPESGLYTLATDHFDPITGVFKSDDLKNESWYAVLQDGERRNVWWGQRTGRSGAAMIYSAMKKTSIKDGRAVGTVLIGANTGSLRGLFENAALTSGFHLLVDEGGKVIFSERYSFLESVGDLPFVNSSACRGGSIDADIDGARQRVMCETLDNGWKLLTAVPESHFGRYTFAISAIGALSAAFAVLVAGLWLRRIVSRVTVPITRLVNAVQRPEVLAFHEPLPSLKSGIYEVETLNEKFTSMLVTMHGLIEKSFSEEIERRQLQLELLNAQINPHFLYNTLDLINCRAILNGDRETSSIVRSLADVFRYGLNKGLPWIALEGEMKQAEAYLRIQQMMRDDLSAELRVPSALQRVLIPHFLLQPLAENAIVHGFADRTDHCRIEISARQDEQMLILRVADNGKGCDAEERNRALREPDSPAADETSAAQGTTAAGGGYGTLNVHRRIRLLCGEAYGLRYVRVEEGTCVEAVLPLHARTPIDREEESPDDVI